MKGLRVLMTADAVGGVWTYAIQLIRALQPHSVTVALATMGAPLRTGQRREACALPNLSVLFESAYRLEWMENPWADVRAAGDWLLGLETAFAPDIVHLNGFAHGALPWRAPRVMVGHSCVLSWWEAVRGEPAPSLWDRYREAVAAGLSAADRVVAPTRAMLGALERHYGVSGGTVIPNGLAPRRPARSDPPQRRAELVLSAGRLWDDAKNARALAAVAPRLPWPVYVAGDDSHPQGGTQGLEGLHVLGRLAPAELAAWYARAPIYALPALYEPFGLTVLEAATAGCALVLGDIPSLRENWGGAAVFVPPSDPAALEGALLKLIEDAPQRAAMQQSARERARAFTAGRMARRYFELYTAALAREFHVGLAGPQAGNQKRAQHPLATARGSEQFSEPRLAGSGIRCLSSRTGRKI